MAKVTSTLTRRKPTSAVSGKSVGGTVKEKTVTSTFTESGYVSAAIIDYSGIIASLNLLTDTLDTAYDGTDPTLAGMETALDTINGEIITP